MKKEEAEEVREELKATKQNHHSNCTEVKKVKGFKASIYEMKSIPGGKVFRPLQKNKNPIEKNKLLQLPEAICLYVSGYMTLLPILLINEEDSNEQLLSDEHKLKASFSYWDSAVRKLFDPFGAVSAVEFISNRTYCFVCYAYSEAARSAYEYFNSNDAAAFNANIRVRYAIEEREDLDSTAQGLPEPTNCNCDYIDTPSTDPTSCISVELSQPDHGESTPERVHLWLNFVSLEEERQLLQEIDTATEGSDAEDAQSRPETAEEGGLANKPSEGLWLKSISRRVQVVQHVTMHVCIYNRLLT
jgi:hypothetical protein